MSRAEDLREEWEKAGIEVFCRRRYEVEDMPVKLMRSLAKKDMAPDRSSIEEVPRSGTRWSKRLIQILDLIADGHTNDEIAFVCTLSTETVKSHVQTILAILGARSRAHAVHIAHQRRLL